MKKVNYTKELLEEKIKDCYSFAELCRRLGLKPEGSNPKTVRKKLEEFGVDYSHFTGQGWNKKGHPKYGKTGGKDISEILINGKKYKPANLRLRLIVNGLKENKCEICRITEWQNKPITIQLHHIDGNRDNNTLENLLMLCPNCHSQTHNFCRRKDLDENVKNLSAQDENLEVEEG